MLYISLRGQWKENKLSRVGNPKLDLMLGLLQRIEEDLIENDQSEIEHYDSDDDKRDLVKITAFFMYVYLGLRVCQHLRSLAPVMK